MKVRISKWVEGIAPGDATGKIVVRTLKARLDAVEHYLKLAAKKADKDVEYVHNLRIWTRRATAALKLYDELLPRREAAWFRKGLKRIRHAAGDARDYDVLAESLAHDISHQATKPCLKRIRKMREKAQKPLIAVHKKLKREDRFERRLEKLLRHVQHDDKTKIPPFSEWAHARLQPIVKNFFAAAPGKEADLKALHRFRIRGKELRYAMELLAGTFPSDFRRRFYPIVEDMQDRLGKINDLVSARTRLQKLLDDTGNVAEKKHLLNLLKQEQARLEQARRDFMDWCAPPFLATLHADFSAMLKAKPVKYEK